MVTLICRFVAYSARIVIDIQTDRQNDYRNPRCACAPRVNSTLLSCALQAAHQTPPTGYGPRTMAESKTTVSLVPLNGSNYPTWKVQCRMALVRDGLWGIVEGTETAPPVEGTADRRSKFIARRDRALATIVLAVEPSLLYLIGDPEDPVVVWQKLQDQFQKKTWANKLVLRRRLHSLRLRDGESVQEHIKTMIELFNELAIVGDAIDEEDRVVYLLASLPDSFNTLVTALETSRRWKSLLKSCYMLRESRQKNQALTQAETRQ